MIVGKKVQALMEISVGCPGDTKGCKLRVIHSIVIDVNV